MLNSFFIITLFLGTNFLISSCDKEDDACTESTWYQDTNGGGLGNPGVNQSACDQPTGYVTDNTDTDDAGNTTDNEVDVSLFFTNGTDFALIVNCTRSDSTATKYYQIVSIGVPSDHEMDLLCPDNIANGVKKEGIWLEEGQVYDVDGAFIQNIAPFYNDDKGLVYHTNREIYTTKTQEDCSRPASSNVGQEYEKFCVECLPLMYSPLMQLI